MHSEPKIFVWERDYGTRYEVSIYRDHPSKECFKQVLIQDEWVEAEEGTWKVPFTFQVRRELVPQLIDALANKFKQGGGSLPSIDHTRGELEATLKHLADMKAITFNVLKIKNENTA